MLFFVKLISSLLLSRLFGRIIHDVEGKYSHIGIADLRKFEKISIKTRKAELDLNFVRNCQSFNVLPKFMCVDLPNVSQHDTTSIRKFSSQECSHQTSKGKPYTTTDERRAIEQDQRGANGFGFVILKRSLSKNVDKAKNKVIMTDQKKLEKLTRNTFLPFTSDETVTNISSTRLTQEQLGILKLGLNHSICPPKISKSDVFSCFELIHHTRHKNVKDSKMAGKLATDLSHLAHSYVSTFHPSKRTSRDIRF